LAKGWTDPHETDDEAKARYLSRLGLDAVTMTKGAMVRKNAWYDWTKKTGKLLPNFFTMLLHFIYVNIVSGDLRREYELDEVSNAAMDRGGVNVITDASAPASSSASSSSSSSSSSGAPAAAAAPGVGSDNVPLPEAASKKRVDVQALRKKSRTILVFVLRLLASMQLYYELNMLFLCTEVPQREHGKLMLIQACKEGPHEMRRIFCGWARGKWNIQIK
jgi:hypothetical protein